MRKEMFFYLVGIILLICGCNTKPKQEEFKPPNGAFPIVYRGHIYLQGNIDSVNGNFVFDTGASNLYYDSTFYASHDFRYENFIKGKLPGAGATPQDVIVVMDTVNFTFGKYKYSTPIVPVFQLKPILGDFSDGIIGMEYFYQSVLEIDYIHEYMKLYPKIDSIDTSGYRKLGLRRIRNRLFVPLAVMISDSLAIHGNFQLDFGSGGSISFTSSAAKKYKLYESIDCKTPYFTKYGGVGGESSSFYFIADSLQIGAFAFKDITMNFSLDSSGAMSSNKHLGLLGNEILERFDVLIDFVNNDLYLKPNKSFDDPFKFSRLGFSYVDRNQTKNAWIVTGLYKNSHAEKEGLRIDDRIIAVNAIEISKISYLLQKDFFDELKEVELTVMRHDEMKKIKFILESIQ